MTQVFLNVMSASFHGSIVIVVVLLLRLVLRKTPKKFLCLLWLLAGIRLMLPFEIQSKLSLQPETATQVVQVQEQRMEVKTPVLPVAIPEAVETTPALVQPSIPEGSVQQTPEFDWLEGIAWLWFVIALGFGCYEEVMLWQLKRKVRFAVQIPGGWESENIDTAFILAGIHPKIYIPMGMSETDKKYILAHEQTHLEKGDHWIKAIGYIALAIHWFNPLVWAAYICLCRDIELACDERVVQFMNVQERKEYSAALLKCSSSGRHLVTGPVAFGEISVKNRILSVLRYKKPGFWISLLGVVAIGFVAICLVTSPIEKEEVSLPVPETTEPVVTTLPAEPQSTFARSLTTEEAILEAVTEGIRELKNRESYHASTENITVYPEQEDGEHPSAADIYRYGDDKLVLSYMDYGTGVISNLNSQVYYGDLYGVHYGDYWVEEGSRAELELPDVDNWLDNYLPTWRTVTEARVVSEDTVSFDTTWNAGFTGADIYVGTVAVTFHDDGTIAKMEQTWQVESGTEPYYHHAQVTILVDLDPQQIYKVIADHAIQCISQEKLEEVRENRNKMTEIPSNKTDYDQDVTSGSISRQWEFLDKQWHVRIGSENVTPTGLTQTFEESGNDHAAFRVEEGFWLETFDGSNWKLLIEPLELAPAESRSISVTWETKDSYAIDWSASYGTLPEGYYRIGRYFTVTMPDGRTETAPCYCKFQIRNQDVEALLKECEQGVANLIAGTDYYLKVWNDMRNEQFHGRIDADSHYMTTEVWRSGDDFYKENIYYYKSDGSVKNVNAMLLRSGKGYSIRGAENIAISSITEATASQVDWIDAESFELWAGFAALFSPTDLVEVYKDQANIIHVKESSDFYDGVPFEEQRYSFTGDGRLVGYQRIYIAEDGTEYVDFEMERYRTAEGETRQKIDSVSVE